MATTTWGQNLFINELHYDDSGTDTLEGIEVAGQAGLPLSCFKFIFYNGSTGAAYDSLQLSGIIPNQCNGFGVAAFPVPGGLQNGGPDGIALAFDPTLPGCGIAAPPAVLQFISYEGAFIATNSMAAGMKSRDIRVVETSSTGELLSLQLSGAGAFYNEFAWNGADSSSFGSVNPGQTFNDTACGTSAPIASQYQFRDLSLGCITPGQTFSCAVCATDANGRIDVNYFAGSALVTLSKISGPGTLSGTLTQPVFGGCAYFTDLSVSAAGSIQLMAMDAAPFGTGISGNSRTISIQAACDSCPSMTGAFIDACGSTEGNNEILFFNTGSYSVPANSMNWSISYGTTSPPATIYSNNSVANSAYIDSLNAWAGCNIFASAADSGFIPPNTDFLVMQSGITNPYNFSGWCSQGPIYVVFTADPNWVDFGNWKNCLDCATSGATPRYFQAEFTDLFGGDTCSFIYNYTPCTDLLCLGNGDGLNFGYGGGGPTASWSQCTPLAVLPAELGIPLQAAWNGSFVELDWATAFEQGTDKFEVLRGPTPRGPFTTIGQVKAAGNSEKEHPYHFNDLNFKGSRAFYRLRQLDINGESSFSNIAEIWLEASASTLEVGMDIAQQQVSFSWPGNDLKEIWVYSMEGKLIWKSGNLSGNAGRRDVSVSDWSEGVYLYRGIGPEGAATGRFSVIR